MEERNAVSGVRYRSDENGRRRRVVINDNIEGYNERVIERCSGCAPCDPYTTDGPGCSECGYKGRRRATYWVPFNFDEWLETI